MKKFKFFTNNERGATVVFVAVTLLMLLMFAALAIDVGHLYAVRNELQDAADAGALAGAGVLFNNVDGTLNREAAITESRQATEANRSGNLPITVGSVEIGHWSFSSHTFTASQAAQQTEWVGRSAEQLDLDTNFINAVKVRTDRSNTPSFFASLLGYERFFVSTDAVAYIGFTGDVFPTEVDQPIALCYEAITDGKGKYLCDTARMINDNVNNGGWTNLQQPGMCENLNNSGANAQEVRPLVCSGNITSLKSGVGLQMINGQVQSAFDDLYDCWREATGRTQPFEMTLPVIECGDGVIGGCKTYKNPVTVTVIWINRTDNAQNYNDAPRSMSAPPDSDIEDWTYDTAHDAETNWNNFASNFGLGTATYEQMTIYLLTSCQEQPPRGRPGGQPMNGLSDIPVLVE